jgi:hypothetical protein
MQALEARASMAISPLWVSPFGKCTHNPADIGQASSSPRILHGALAAACLFFELDLLKDRGSAVLDVIFFNVAPGVSEAIADQVIP